MVQPFKSSFELTGNNMNKEQMEELQSIELALSGNNEDLKNIPSTLNEVGKAYYIENLKNMNKATLSNLDKSLLETLANIQARLYECNLYLNEHGTILESVDGRGNLVIKDHPFVKQHKEYAEQLLKLSAKLGLSPIDRAGMARDVSKEVVNSKNTPVNDFQEMLKKNINANKDRKRAE